MKRAIIFLLAAGVPSSAHARFPRPPLAARTPAVTVHGDRIVLGDLSPTAPRGLLEVDVAPSPAPGRQTVVSRQAVRAALHRVGAEESLANGLPAQQVVARAATDLTVAELRAEVEASISAKLPMGLFVEDILGLTALTLPTGAISVEVRYGRLRRSSPATVLVHVDGRLVARQTATVQLGGTPSTPTLRNDLPRGAIVTPQDVEMSTMPLDRLPSGVVTKSQNLVGKRLVQPTQAGRPVQSRAVKVPPAVARGSTVSVVVVATGLRISRSAVAQQDGNVGDTISLQPTDGGRIIRGRVHSPQEVHVYMGAQGS